MDRVNERAKSKLVVENNRTNSDGWSFGKALDWLKKNPKAGISRQAWDNTNSQPVVHIQYPNENSYMSYPYLYMEKFVNNGNTVVRFPVDLSCESLLAEDWVLLETGKWA